MADGQEAAPARAATLSSRRGRRGLLFAAFLLGLAQLLRGAPAASAAGDPAQNWPEWRGPLRSGEAPNANPPVHWSEASNIKWKVEIPGSGSATPIIWGPHIFIQAAVPTGKKSTTAPAQPEPPPSDTRAGGGRGRGGMASEKPDEP